MLTNLLFLYLKGIKAACFGHFLWPISWDLHEYELKCVFFVVVVLLLICLVSLLLLVQSQGLKMGWGKSPPSVTES